MKIKITETPEGNVVLIKIGKRFDISSHHLFSEACHLADDPTTSNIVVDLSKTRYLHDFGLALLLMLNRHAAALNHNISLINCHPEIEGRLSNAHLH